MRTEELEKIARRRKLDLVLVANQANIRALTGINCDNAVLMVERVKKVERVEKVEVAFYTDFRYVPMVHRVAPKLKCRDIKRFGASRRGAGTSRPRRIGYESTISHARFLEWQKKFPKAKFVDISKDLATIRAVKTPDEIAALRAAEKLNCEIWETARGKFKAGMTERQMARIIQKLMIEKGEGEAFDTIVCVGKNAAECHHEPDGTVWNGREPVLVDMGVKLNGVCSDLTRNLLSLRKGRGRKVEVDKGRFGCQPQPLTSTYASPLYRKVYQLVLKANLAAIAAAKPGLTGKALDKVARDVIKKGGFGKCFGHSLGHGVGYEIHEAPYASKKGDMTLKPGMLVTIEPGIYLEDNLGVRIEDLILITATGCEVLSALADK